MSDSLWPHGHTVHGILKARILELDSLSLLQGIFPTQESNPGLPHCMWILYQLSHKGSPRILEWVAYPFSSWSFQPRNQMGVSCIAGGFFTNWASRETSTSALLTTPKPLTVWITTNSGKFLKRWIYQTTFPASWEIYMKVRKQQLELDVEQHTGIKLGKEYIKPVYSPLLI